MYLKTIVLLNHNLEQQFSFFHYNFVKAKKANMTLFSIRVILPAIIDRGY
jgi:hypothetical protein